MNKEETEIQIKKSYEIISALNSGMKGFTDLWNNTDALERKCIVEMIGRQMEARQPKQGEGEEKIKAKGCSTFTLHKDCWLYKKEGRKACIDCSDAI